MGTWKVKQEVFSPAFSTLKKLDLIIGQNKNTTQVVVLFSLRLTIVNSHCSYCVCSDINFSLFSCKLHYA